MRLPVKSNSNAAKFCSRVQNSDDERTHTRLLFFVKKKKCFSLQRNYTNLLGHRMHFKQIAHENYLRKYYLFCVLYKFNAKIIYVRRMNIVKNTKCSDIKMELLVLLNSTV